MSLSQVRRSRKQRSIREAVNGEALEAAVPTAIASFFRFTHRTGDRKALWCDSLVVWLGRSTFLTWCLEDAEIDIPWVVANSVDAPNDKKELRTQVRLLARAYFESQLGGLPPRSTGSWLPLP